MKKCGVLSYIVVTDSDVTQLLVAIDLDHAFVSPKRTSSPDSGGTTFC